MTVMTRSNPAVKELRPHYWCIGIVALVIITLSVALGIRTGSGLNTNLTEARTVLRGPATISVIGDSTSNDMNEWVALWAVELGRDHKVTLQRWLDGSYRPNPPEYGRSGDTLTIWNASQPGGAANWATGQLAAVQPEVPDLIILSLGHNNTQANIASQLDQLYHQLPAGVPAVLILQNPGRGTHKDSQAATLGAADDWARFNHISTIDVTAAFTDVGSQMYDDIHPNDAGSRVWADTVYRALNS